MRLFSRALTSAVASSVSGEERRIGGGGFFQAEIATPRGQPIGLGKARGEHFGRDARRRDGDWARCTADGDRKREEREVPAMHRYLDTIFRAVLQVKPSEICDELRVASVAYS